MKVLLVNSYDLEGGAARAVYRLHEGFKAINVDSQMLVQFKSSKDISILSYPIKMSNFIGKVRSCLDRLPLNSYHKREGSSWSLQWLDSNIDKYIQYLNPDVLHLHWIASGFFPITSFSKIKCPIVWTLHDMWAFTGGCHYDEDCRKYRENCGACPQLNSINKHDLSNKIWVKKNKYWEQLKLSIVTPSHWLRDCVSQSSLLKDQSVNVIHNGLDLEIFHPIEKFKAKEKYNLPQDLPLILFGAMNSTSDKRKGFEYLQRALAILSKSNLRAVVGIFGSPTTISLAGIRFPIFNLGVCQTEESLSTLYSAADVFVAPSIQDNLPNTVLEAIACGTPCVAFRIGGMPDMIEHEGNGYLAKPLDSDDLAKGIEWVLKDKQRHQALCIRSREKSKQEFSLIHQAEQYKKLYETLLK